MDNFRIYVTAEGDKSLADVMAIAFRQQRVATHYAVRQPDEMKPLRLVFMWSGSGNADAVALPFKLDAAGAADFAARWLAEADYGREPDHDGDNGRGWTIYNEGWGHVDGSPYAFVGVTPSWAMYGK